MEELLKWEAGLIRERTLGRTEVIKWMDPYEREICNYERHVVIEGDLRQGFIARWEYRDPLHCRIFKTNPDRTILDGSSGLLLQNVNGSIPLNYPNSTDVFAREFLPDAEQIVSFYREFSRRRRFYDGAPSLISSVESLLAAFEQAF